MSGADGLAGRSALRQRAVDYCAKHGVQQGVLSEIAGCGKTFISSLLRGNPTGERMARLRNFLDDHPDGPPGVPAFPVGSGVTTIAQAMGQEVQKSRAKAGGDDAAAGGHSAASEPVSRPAGGRSPAATSEPMDVTAGETAPDPTPPVPIAIAVAREAEAAGEARRAARRCGGIAGGASLSVRERVTAAMIETPRDLTAMIDRRWPELLGRVFVAARAGGETPGDLILSLLDQGLSAREAA